jgi:hypothetical protein
MNAPSILLFGLPRSGTTWVGKVFDSHPNTLYRHEPDSWGRLNAIPLLADRNKAHHYETELSRFVELLPFMRETKVTASLPVFAKNYYSPARFLMRRVVVAGSKLAAKVLGEVPVPACVDFKHHSSLILVWKSIESVGRLGLVATLYPNSKALLLMRHPCGLIASILRGERQGRFTARELTSDDYGILAQLLETPSGQAYGLNLNDLRRLSPVERLAWRWVLFNEHALHQIEGLPNCRAICYEDICADPEREMQSLFTFTGLEWLEQTARFITESTTARGESYYSLYKDPQKVSRKWETELTKTDIQKILSIVERTSLRRFFTNDKDRMTAAE